MESCRVYGNPTRRYDGELLVNNALKTAGTKLAKALSPLHIKAVKNKKRIINNFCDDYGLVYFGSVSQREDDHQIVRGLTVSNAHKDSHYCIGSNDGYDVIFVERSDTILTNNRHVWHIMEIDLKLAKDLPHIFIGSPTHGMGFHTLLKTKYPYLSCAPLGAFGKHSTEFTDFFYMFTRPDQWVMAERIFTPDITETVGKHFRGLVLEIAKDSLFVYSEKPYLTPQLLTTMLTNGIWLARMIDTKTSPQAG